MKGFAILWPLVLCIVARGHHCSLSYPDMLSILIQVLREPIMHLELVSHDVVPSILTYEILHLWSNLSDDGLVDDDLMKGEDQGKDVLLYLFKREDTRYRVDEFYGALFYDFSVFVQGTVCAGILL